MIDWSRVHELRTEIGSEEFREVAEMFLAEADGVVDGLPLVTEPGVLRERLHFLKGSALNLGFVDLVDMCTHGERLAAEGESARIDLEKLVKLYGKSRSLFLERFLEDSGRGA